MMPKVSVVIPVYNVEKYLQECLDSVINQTMKDIEIICVDDGSTDSSLSILKEYASKDNRFIILQQNNKGAGVARNTGLDIATGKYIYFMDSDDYCDLTLLEKAFMQAEITKADIVVFNFSKFENSTKKKMFFNGMNVSYIENIELFSYLDCPDKICSLVNPTPWNKFFNKEFITKHNLFYLSLSTTNDITFATLSVICAERMTYINETLYFYRIGDFENITSKKRKNLNNIIQAVLEVDRFAQKLSYYNIIKKSIRTFIINNLFIGLERYAGDPDSAYYIEYKKQLESIFFSYPLFLGIEKKDLDNTLFEKIDNYRNNAYKRRDYRYLPSIILSMTSFPRRIGTVHKAIASLFKQSYSNFTIILWLSTIQFPNKNDDLPEELLEFTKFGLKIRWCEEDLRPHKKYYYAIKEYPNSIIITFDDDLIYDMESVEILLSSYMKYPTAISTLRAHLITLTENNEIAPYSEWIKECNKIVGYPSMRLFSTSGAGTLYPPNCMDEMLFDKEAIQEICLNADDIWLKIMQMLSGTPVVLAQKNKRLRYIDGTQEIALQNSNVFKNANDTQLYNLIKLCEIRKNKSMMWFVEAINTNLILKNNTILIPKLTNKNSSLPYYKIKKAITYVPRKFYGGIRCCQEHGFKYTIFRIKEKIKNKFM